MSEVTFSGLSPLLAASTKATYFPGGNKLGYVLQAIRQDLMREAILSYELGIDGLLRPVALLWNFCRDIPPRPPTLLPLSNVLEEGRMNMNK